jgi:hypothetical protein
LRRIDQPACIRKFHPRLLLAAIRDLCATVADAVQASCFVVFGKLRIAHDGAGKAPATAPEASLLQKKRRRSQVFAV